MNKKERDIILNTYKDALTSKNLGFDKDDTIRTFKFMLGGLGLERERYMIENKMITDTKEYDIIVEDTFRMIFDTFARYNILVSYDLDEIEEMYENNLAYKFSSEDEICYQARVKILKERLA